MTPTKYALPRALIAAALSLGVLALLTVVGWLLRGINALTGATT
jgi:hypothetical protein